MSLRDAWLSVALALERWGEMSLAGALARGPLPIETALRLGAPRTGTRRRRSASRRRSRTRSGAAS